MRVLKILKFIWNLRNMFLLTALFATVGFSFEIKAVKGITYILGGIIFLRVYVAAWKLIIQNYKTKQWASVIIGTILATFGVVFVGCMLSDLIWKCPCW